MGGTGTTTTTTTAAARAPALQSWLGGQQQARRLTEEAKEAIERTLVVDTLATAKKFESVGMDRRDAEAMTSYLTEQIVLDRGRLAEKFVHKSDLEKTLIEERALVAAFKAELSQKQDLHLATLHKDLERQQAYLEKIKADLRHEIDKLSASQRLDLNLEKGRMRDDLQMLRDRSSETEIKLDRCVSELNALIEKSKTDLIKSVIAIFGTFSAIVFTITRLVSL